MIEYQIPLGLISMCRPTCYHQAGRFLFGASFTWSKSLLLCFFNGHFNSVFDTAAMRDKMIFFAFGRNMYDIPADYIDIQNLAKVCHIQGIHLAVPIHLLIQDPGKNIIWSAVFILR